MVCEACCAPNDTFHAECANVDPAKMPAGWDGKWWCEECAAEKKAQEDAAEKAALAKDKDRDYEEEVKSKKKPAPRGQGRPPRPPPRPYAIRR